MGQTTRGAMRDTTREAIWPDQPAGVDRGTAPQFGKNPYAALRGGRPAVFLGAEGFWGGAR